MLPIPINTVKQSLPVAVFAVLTGITISFYADLPAGATVVMVNFLLFVLSFLIKKFVR